MKNISVRVPEWLFLEVEESARKCGISKGAVLRQLALKHFDCETLQDFEAEPRTPLRDSLAESRTPLVRAASIKRAQDIAKRNAAVVHLPEHDIKDGHGYTPWERHVLTPLHPEHRSLAI